MPEPLPPTQPSRLLHRPLTVIALLIGALFALAFVVSLTGIHLLGSVERWQHWLDEHAGHFYAWRLCLYCAVLAAWPWARRRRLARDPQSRRPLRLIEVFGVLGIVLSEASYWLQRY